MKGPAGGAEPSGTLALLRTSSAKEAVVVGAEESSKLVGHLLLEGGELPLDELCVERQSGLLHGQDGVRARQDSQAARLADYGGGARTTGQPGD